MADPDDRRTERQRETHARIEEALKQQRSRCDELALAGLGVPPEWLCQHHLAERVEEVRKLVETARDGA